jgi:predicted transposase/invertase (TIGR01784 family)
LNEIIVAKEEIKMAYDLLTNISRNEDERARFRARRKFQMDMEHNRIVAFEEGEIKGELKGKLKVARNLLANGMSMEFVVQNTGLSPNEILTPAD